MGGIRAYRPDIDGLRAVAVLAVVGYHAGLPYLSGGYVGVDIFFVISGFLITGLLLDEHSGAGRVDLGAFWSRRVRRILPALIVTIALTALAAWAVLLPWEQRDFLRSVRSSILSIANFHFHGVGGGYFSTDLESQPLLHTWSLGIEEQFYLVWPLTLVALLRFGRTAVGSLTTLLLLVSLIASIRAVAHDPMDGFYLPWFRVWELLIGALLAFAIRSTRWRSAPRIGSVMGIALIAYAVFSFDSSTRFPGVAALIPTVGAALVIASSPTNDVNRILSWRPLRGIGLVSYSWYLLHWPALVLVRVQTQSVSLARDVLVALATLPLAILSWRLVEQAFRSPRQHLLGRPRLVIGFALSAIAIVTVTSTAAMPRSLSASETTHPPAAENSTAAPVRDVAAAVPTVNAIDWSSRIAELEASRNVPDLPCTNYELPMPFDPRCRLVGGDSTIVLIGDSHAASIAPVFVDIATRHSWGLALASQPRCPAVPDVEILICETDYTECAAWVREVIDDVVTNAALVRAVVVTSRSSYYFPGESLANDAICQADIGIDGSPADLSQATDIWKAGLERLAMELAENGIPLVIVHDVPELERWPSECLTRRSVEQCSVNRKRADEYASAARSAEDSAAELDPSITIVDPFPVLCDAESCAPTRGDVIVYRDDHHLTPAGSRLLMPTIEAALAALPRGRISTMGVP